MAKTQIGRKGFGQVEPNHLSGIVDGKIYAQLPVDKETMGEIIENGRFAKYDMATGKVNLTGKSQWCMIYNEIKLYDERLQGLKDFALIGGDSLSGEITPRLIAIEVGDIFTTNTFGANEDGKDSPLSAKDFDVEGIALEQGDLVYIGADGYLTLTESTEDNAPKFQVVKVYTMPDGQPGVKLQRIA
jgi:hypothetical protein